MVLSYNAYSIDFVVRPYLQFATSTTITILWETDVPCHSYVKYGKIDFLVHAIAFSDKNELKGKYTDTSRENFLNTLDISCYSFVKTAKKASEIMNPGGSILTLTYYGAEKVIPNYNVMGVAKAALEASVKYIAADLGEKNIRVIKWGRASQRGN